VGTANRWPTVIRIKLLNHGLVRTLAITCTCTSIFEKCSEAIDIDQLKVQKFDDDLLIRFRIRTRFDGRRNPSNPEVAVTKIFQLQPVLVHY